MKCHWLALIFTLSACGNAPDGNAMTNAAVPDGPMPAGAPPLPAGQKVDCPVPGLDFTEVEFSETEKIAFANNWTVAVDRACAEKLAGDKPLNHPDVLGPMLLLFLAPEANIISIYSNDRRKPERMVMEGPFGTPSQAPSAEDLYEAIYCSVKGATPEEEEQSGRCLPD
jgi:hypothetical protein